MSMEGYDPGKQVRDKKKLKKRERKDEDERASTLSLTRCHAALATVG
jgi:hypothetical protein